MRRIALLTFVFAALFAPSASAEIRHVDWLGRVGGWATSAPISAHRFDVAGVRRSGAHLQLRARSHGRWSRWVDAHAEEPVVALGSRAVQLRAKRPLSGLRVRLIRAPKTHAAAAARRKQPSTLPLPTTNAPAPSIIPRSSWDPGNRCAPRTTPIFGDIQLAFVHHTVSVNNYSRSQSPGIVLGICLFHRNGNGWNDMGYNFLVDRYGQVFEGRECGIDQPVVGAQAGGFNTPSTGVSMIGDFSNSVPPKPAMNALARLLAWKLSIHAVPANGKTTVTSAGGSSTGYPAGRRITLNRISGHRDADLTECPGAALYKRLPALRRQVAKLEGPISGLTLASSASTVTYPASPTLSGVLTLPGGAHGAGETVELRALAGGRERVVASGLTAPDGSWSVTPPPLSRSSVLRAVFPGDGADAPGVISPLAGLTVVPAISIKSDHSQAAPGDTVTISGTVRPAKRRVSLSVSRGARQASVRRIATDSGRFSAKVKLPRAGAYRITASVPADSRTSAARSPAIRVQAG